MPVSTSTPKVLAPGIYCPTVTFFRDTQEQELDLETFNQHMEFLARSGVHGVVVQGSTAEAVTLDREERKALIRAAKDAFTRVGNTGAIIAGTVGSQSTREAIALGVDAAEAGADFTLTLPPSYFPGMMTPAAIQSFFEEVAERTPIPTIIYSYPGVCSGISMDTDLIIRLAQHPKIAGIKHTDHEVGRIAREVAQLSKVNSPFTVLGGASDYLLGGLAVGGKGAITGMANVAPRVCVKAFELFQAGRTEEAMKYASVISTGEWAMGKGGILGTKYFIAKANSYPSSAAKARRPLLDCLEGTKQHIDVEGKAITELERQLEKEGYVGAGLSGQEQGQAQTVKSKVVNGNGPIAQAINGLVQ